MEAAFFVEGQIIITALERAKKTIQAIDCEEINAVKFRIVRQLNSTINIVRTHQCQLEPITFDDLGNPVDTKELLTTGPLTRLFGKEISPGSQQQDQPAIPDDPNEADIKNLMDKFSKIDKIENEQGPVTAASNDPGQQLQDSFLLLTDDQILEQYPDKTIRDLARKLDFPVSETMPKTITAKFLQEMRERIESTDDSNEQ
jgi:hypothetical protein